MRNIYLAIVAALACLTLTLCYLALVFQETEVSDDSYSQSVGVKGQWEVHFNGYASVEVDPADGSVSVYGRGWSEHSHLHYPDIKVSGSAIFKIYSGDNVKVEDGTTAFVFYSNLVKGSHHSNLYVANCKNVTVVWDVARLDISGSAPNIERLPKPTAVQPAGAE